MAAEQQVVSRLEESCLIIGIYLIGPLVAGIAICLLIVLLQYIITNPSKRRISSLTESRQSNQSLFSSNFINFTWSNREYWFGTFSILFTIILNISYCILGTDLLVPFNDNTNIEDSYNTNTMLQFTSFCMFLWHFSKLFCYLSFICFAYSMLSLPTNLKKWLKIFMYAIIILTITHISFLIYLNYDLYQVEITPNHDIQLIAQLKGHFFYKNHNNSITELASMIPILIDISCLMFLFKIFIERSQQV